MGGRHKSVPVCERWASSDGWERRGGSSGCVAHHSRALSADRAVAFADGDSSYDRAGGGGRADVSGMAIHGAYAGGWS